MPLAWQAPNEEAALRALVFDVNETLLDLSVLDPHFERVFGDAGARREWFSLVLSNALCLTITGDHTDFVAVGRASLQMVADRRSIVLGDEDRATLAAAMTSMPAHADVLPNMERLAGAGFRMAALTNSPLEAARSQLQRAGIAPFLDEVMSVDTTGRFKPAREVYEYGAARLGLATSQIRMVAAHDWDVAGAMRAGCAGAFLMRPGTARNPLYPQPDIVEPDLTRLADRIIEMER
jgi:2-haloacid dehalogenase